MITQNRNRRWMLGLGGAALVAFVAGRTHVTHLDHIDHPSDGAPTGASLASSVAPPAAAEARLPAPKPATPAAAMERVRAAVAQTKGPHASELLKQLDDERAAYDDIARAYDDLHQRYQDGYRTHATEETLRAQASEFDALMGHLWEASSRIHRATSELSEALVADALATNDVGATGPRARGAVSP